MRHFRLLLGDQPMDGVEVGLRPDSAAYLRGEFNAMKALYEYFRDDLDTDFTQAVTRSAVELSEFQEDAVKEGSPHPGPLR